MCKVHEEWQSMDIFISYLKTLDEFFPLLSQCCEFKYKECTGSEEDIKKYKEALGEAGSDLYAYSN
jgi:hypothetical protein